MIAMRHMIRRCCGIGRDESGGPLAELALVVPFLLLLLFGAFEFARLLYVQNLVTKGVQDAARYLARHPALLQESSCPPTGAAWTSALNASREIAARGNRTVGSSLIYYEFDPTANPTQLSITVSCESASRNGQTLDSTLTGGIPIVVVTAAVPVADIGFFGFINMAGGSFTIRAEHREMAIGL